MSDEMTRREKWAASDAARDDARWGMSYAPDPRVASSERLAYEAHERGDQWFQIDLNLNFVQGSANLAQGFSRVQRGPQPARDEIGLIEAQGWKLEHVAATFVHHGTSTMGAIGGAAEHATHGALVVLYVFRRAS
jgi:hypothetical protein